MKRPSLFLLSLLAALALSPAGHGAGDVLFSEDFSGDLSKWTPLKASAPWEISDGAVVSSGTVIFDVLETRSFVPITDGSFDFRVEVRFESAMKSPNNRFFLRMRDSESGNQGYEVVVAQGTSGNTLMTEIKAEKSLSQTLESEPFVFPTDDFVPIRWVRDKKGRQQLFVDGVLYLQAEGGAPSSFNKLVLGTRSYVEAAGETSPMRHYFRNVELKEGPDSL